MLQVRPWSPKRKEKDRHSVSSFPDPRGPRSVFFTCTVPRRQGLLDPAIERDAATFFTAATLLRPHDR